jgi:hypothetical protein
LNVGKVVDSGFRRAYDRPRVWLPVLLVSLALARALALLVSQPLALALLLLALPLLPVLRLSALPERVLRHGRDRPPPFQPSQKRHAHLS